MDLLMLVVSIAIPWLLGVALLRLVPERAEPGHVPGSVAWSLGCGWFVGAFVLTLWMRALSLTGVKFGFAVVALPLAGAALLALAVLLRRDGRALRDAVGHAARTLGGSGLEGWKRAAWFALLAWLGLRFALLLFENVERPLYAWDAWAHWATKARVWFELKSIVPFVSASEWLQATGLAYTDYNPHYPGTVPLLQVWGALALGRWDDALINLPWWVTGVALALAIYGFLAERGLGALTALVGAWLVVSLPIFDTHVALPGYADLPLAAYFALAGLALWRWLDRRGWNDAALVLLFACACVTIKNPGRAWVLVLVPAVIAGIVPRQGVRIAFASLGAAILLLLALARMNLTLFGYQLHLDFTPPWQGLTDAYLLYGNWHLLWYAALAIAVLCWRQLLTKEIAPLTVLLASSLLFLLFGFAFTNASAWVEDQSTVNRATLPVAPLLVVWILVVFEAWAARIAPTMRRSSAEASSRTPAIPEFKRLAEARATLGAGTSAAASPEPPTTSAPTSDAAPLPVVAQRPVPGPLSTGAPTPAHSSEATATERPSAPSQGASTQSIPVPKVGRNDPCPCGSGKRYKQCHGAVSQQADDIPAATASPPQEALFLRGIAAHQQGDVVAAERAYRAALAIAPDHVHASHYLGVALYQTQRLDEALPLLQHAAQRIPEEPEFHNNFGLALAAADRTEEAIDSYRRALALKPDHALAWNNLGLALQAKGDPAAAIAAYRSALEFAPEFAQAHWNLSLALLASGDLAEGWREYEWRLRIPELGKNDRVYEGPRWSGSNPAGQTILLTREQGFGDTLQFARLARVFAERGARVVMEVPEPLVGLIARVPGVASVHAAGTTLPGYDAHLPLLSAPHALGITAETIPADVPYLSPDPVREAAIAAELAPYSETLKVGIAWAGNRANASDRIRSCALAELAPLFELPGITWFSLQRSDEEAQIASVPAAERIVLLPARNDFDGKAALVSALDLVISVDTSSAHLAGALGRPLWLLLAYAPDWRWQVGRNDSPWYPTAQLFRQPRAGDWAAVVAAVGAALAEKIKRG